MSVFRKAKRSEARLRLALVGGPGDGKAQPLHSKILTPSGWVTMGDLRVGDTIFDCDGREQKVTAIYPQGVKPIFEVFFSDGTSTQCCKEHLWFTQTVQDRKKHRVASVKTLAEIAATVRDRSGKRNHFIPITQPVRFPSEGFRPIDPYILGLLIGDGMLGNNCTTFSNPEPELQEALAVALPQGTELRAMGEDGLNFSVRRTASHGGNPLLDSLRLLGLAGHKSIEKFIPESYLFAPVEDRIALLQGLLDTDGYSGDHNIEYSTSSQQLAEDFRFLVQSLGGTATISSRVPRYTHKGEKREGAISYRFFPRLPSYIKPFRLKRKADRYYPRTKYLPYRCIDRVEYVGDMEAQCIAVSSPDHLYLTDHCIVTHNTYSALAIAADLGLRIAVIDTEHGSSEKYAGDFEFDVLRLDTFDPRSYIDAIAAAEAERYDVVIVDSLSHEWMGRGGALELVEKARERSRSGNSFAAWKDVTPLHNALIDAIVRCKCHLIATMRAKTEYVLQTNQFGKQEPVRVGLGAVQRDGMEFEFDITGLMTPEHKLIVQKTRCPALDGQVIDRPGKNVAEILKAWLSDGQPLAAQPEAPGILDRQTAETLRELIWRTQLAPETLRSALAKRGVNRIEDLTGADADEMIAKLRAHLEGAAAPQVAAVPATEPAPEPAPTGDPIRDILRADDARDDVAASAEAQPPAASADHDDYQVAEATRPDHAADGEAKGRRRRSAKNTPEGAAAAEPAAV